MRQKNTSWRYGIVTRLKKEEFRGAQKQLNFHFGRTRFLRSLARFLHH